jgi:hypothetical protein
MSAQTHNPARVDGDVWETVRHETRGLFKVMPNDRALADLQDVITERVEEWQRNYYARD